MKHERKELSLQGKKAKFLTWQYTQRSEIKSCCGTKADFTAGNSSSTWCVRDIHNNIPISQLQILSFLPFQSLAFFTILCCEQALTSSSILRDHWWCGSEEDGRGFIWSQALNPGRLHAMQAPFPQCQKSQDKDKLFRSFWNTTWC